MYFSDNLNKIEFTLYEPQVDMILHALELYAYNIHFIVKKGTEDYSMYNILIFHTYQQIMAHYSSNRYIAGYDPLKNCQLEIDRMKKKNYYQTRNYYKKNIA